MKYKGLLLLFLLLGLAGCPQPQTPIIESPTLPSENMISIYQVAQRLGMKISGTTSTHYKLTDSKSNILLIFTHSNGKFYVNGRPVGDVGPVEKTGSGLLFSESLVSKIKNSIDISPLPPRYEPREKIGGTVVIDAGHGGKDPGATGTNGTREKYINLAIAKKVEYYLKQRGVNVILTRNGDSFIELPDRSWIANRNNARFFVSIHADSNPDRSRRGFTVYVSRTASGQSQRLAQSIINSLSSRTSLNNNGMQRANYKVLVNTSCPAALVETGFLSNYSEANILTSSSFQNSVASAIAEGIYQAL
jgi:N-acetylmuramoyl-L-alanine amidase